jgi:hypothetical protein
MMRIEIFLERNPAPNMREEKSPAARPLRLRGSWLLIEFVYKDGVSNGPGVPRMQSLIRLSPRQPVPGLRRRHSDDRLPQENNYYGIAASLVSLNVSFKKRLRT